MDEDLSAGLTNHIPLGDMVDKDQEAVEHVPTLKAISKELQSIDSGRFIDVLEIREEYLNSDKAESDFPFYLLKRILAQAEAYLMVDGLREKINELLKKVGGDQ